MEFLFYPADFNYISGIYKFLTLIITNNISVSFSAFSCIFYPAFKLSIPDLLPLIYSLFLPPCNNKKIKKSIAMNYFKLN